MHTLHVHVEHTEIAAQYDPTVVHTYHKAVDDSHQKHLSSLYKLAVLSGACGPIIPAVQGALTAPSVTSYPILAD